MGVIGKSWRRLRSPDGLNAVRRRSSMYFDRSWSGVERRLRPPLSVDLGTESRLALVTVNFSTTRWLKLMLLTLCEQPDLALVGRIIVVDNGSRDGGQDFLRCLEQHTDRVHIVFRRHRLHHGPAMRAGVGMLDRIESTHPRPSNILVFCDADVIFRSPVALRTVASSFTLGDVGLVGEVRRGREPSPDIQASFFAVRRDVYARRDIAPLVHDGSPSLGMQRTIVEAGLDVVHIPSNHGGLILHRGRSGVAAAAALHPHHQYSTAPRRTPHFMGVVDGASIWAQAEERHRRLLDPEHESELIVRLSQQLAPVH